MDILRKGWGIILSITVLATLGGALYTVTRVPVYQATSTLAVSACIAVENLPSCDPVGGMSFAVERARIYASAGMSAPVLQMAVDETDVVKSRRTLATAVEVSQTNESPLVEVSARWDNPSDAADLANAVSRALIEYSRGSIDAFESESTLVRFDTINEAVPPSDPVESDTRTVALSLALGLVLGLAVATGRWTLDPRIRDREDAESTTGLDVLTAPPSRPVSRWASTGLPANLADNREYFHYLRSTVASRLGTGSHTVLAIVGASDALSTVDLTRGLARSFAATGDRTASLLLDVQSDSPPGAPGPTPVLSGDANLTQELLQQEETNPLEFQIASSDAEEDPAAFVSSPYFAGVMADLRSSVDVIVLDAGPATRGAVMVSALRYADAVLLVLAPGRSTRSDALETIRTLELVAVPVLGIATVTPR
jgi:capsular polysaccharide biosynthesis protein